MNRSAFVSALLLLSLAGATAQSLPRKKLIATGWDSPSPSQFRAHLTEFEQWPLDGTTIQPRRVRADGKSVDAKFAFSRERWEPNEFTNAIADLKAVRPRTATDNFLMLYANPGDVDWFDDAGWREVVEHWRLLAWVAREGGLKGILFDAEPYTPPHEQFNYSAQPGRDRHTFAEYSAKARQRGREVMRAVVAEFPEIRLFTYRMLCDLLPATANGGDPAALLEFHGYGLGPAFLDGWFDAMPPAVVVIEGDENAYRYNSDAEFDRSFVELRTRALALVAPENHTKFRAQYQISHGIYLDAHVNPPTSPWFIDRLGGTSAARLAANVAAGLRTADEYVWIYGETGRWWPSGDKKFPLWSEKLPGAERALLKAKDSIAAARQRLVAAKPEDNLLRNPGFDAPTPDNQSKEWWFWQDDKSRGQPARDPQVGVSAPGSARVTGAGNGCFGQNVKARPGETYAVSVRTRRQGKGVAGATVRWKTAAGKWTAEAQDVLLTPVGTADAQGWRELAGLVRVPESAGELALLLSVRGQAATNDVAWFDDAQVVLMDDLTPGVVPVVK